MKRLLLCWIGKTDLDASRGLDVGDGPIAQAVAAREFDEAVFLADYPEADVDHFVAWLRERSRTPVAVRPEKLTSPTNFGEIYEAAVRACENAVKTDDEIELTFHLSPGTPAMAAVWIILGKTRFPAELLESSRKYGVRTASVPFDISADFLPDLLRAKDERLRRLSGAEPPEAPEFQDIVHQSRVMRRLIERARRVAARNVPLLIEGETGTGKELLSRAVHNASPRKDKPFVAVNCGAIPTNLVESELFGHVKGAFTGADSHRTGHFVEADGGTLFLDEVGELPLSVQVKLLRVLQEGEVVPVGATKARKVDVRIVAATNRTVVDEIAEGRFREDLFYRLAVAVLKVPALRERPGDVGLLIDHFMKAVNEESREEPGYRDKRISAGARNLLSEHRWPGNVREMFNTLRRAALWSDGTLISKEDAQEALLPVRRTAGEAILGRPLGEGFDIRRLVEKVERHYLVRAMEEAAGGKTKAAELLGLPSYQTLTNWLKRHGIEA